MNRFQQYHTEQRDATDCGAACLLSVLKYYGSNAPLDRLREWSGTSTTGATLLGLYQAAQRTGLEAEGFEADIAHLKSLDTPCILHIVKEESLLHFVVCYQYDATSNTFLIGDPAEASIKNFSPEQLESIWQSKTLLLLKATSNIQSADKESLWYKIKWIYDFIKIDLNLLLTSFTLGVIISVLGLSVAIFSQKLVDDFLPKGDTVRLVVGCALLLFLLLVKTLFTYLRQLFLLRQNKDFNIRILEYFYQSLLLLPKPFFDSRKTGDLIARMNDTSRIQQTVAIVFSSLAIEVVMVIAGMVALFSYSPNIGWVALLWLPIFTFIVYRFYKKILNAQREVMVSYAHNESNYIDTIQGIGTIKVAGKENFFSRITHQFYERFQEARYHLGITGLSFAISAEIAGTFFIVGIILYSSFLVLGGSISIGAVMAIVQLIGMVMASAASIANANIALQEAKVALDRMQEFTTLVPEYKPDEESHKQSLTHLDYLQVKDLDFRFTGRPLLLENITLEVRKGEIIAILGESGCGKSTLLQILQRFYIPENGNIILNGESLESYSITDWRKLLGVVPQQIKLFNGPLLANILLSEPEGLNEETFVAFFENYGFDAFFQKFPAGYETILGETGVNISGGQQQMVALARALYQKPQLLLLDEATSAMDRNTERHILDLLQKLRSEMGIILVTHRTKTASIADRIYIIEDGKIVESGNHQSLMQSKNLYSESVMELTEL
ncbi:MAG: peptidase domain-containing ABC transporter [Saprospiraceae bacterium]|nr:peptidase domain-containing ABC transporter [Saprospiraceae bacterium]